MTQIDHLVRILRAARMPWFPELALQDGIAATLTEHAVAFDREVRIARGDVIDFIVDERVGLEVKVDGSTSSVTRQLHRYAQSDRVSELLLVTTRSRHRDMPAGFAGKPIVVLHLIAGAF